MGWPLIRGASQKGFHCTYISDILNNKVVIFDLGNEHTDFNMFKHLDNCYGISANVLSDEVINYTWNSNESALWNGFEMEL